MGSTSTTPRGLSAASAATQTRPALTASSLHADLVADAFHEGGIVAPMRFRAEADVVEDGALVIAGWAEGDGVLLPCWWLSFITKPLPKGERFLSENIEKNEKKENHPPPREGWGEGLHAQIIASGTDFFGAGKAASISARSWGVSLRSPAAAFSLRRATWLLFGTAKAERVARRPGQHYLRHGGIVALGDRLQLGEGLERRLAPAGNRP